MVSVDDKTALLVYRVGPVYCCSPTHCVDTITIPASLTHPPGTDAAHPGIFRHGGHIVSVSELRYLFGVDQAEWQQPGRMIITSLKEGHVGFWVDEIIDVIPFPDTGWGNLPAHLPRGVFSRTLLLKEQIHFYAEFARLNTLQTAGYLKQYITTLVDEQKQKPGKEHKPQTVQGAATTPTVTDKKQQAPVKQTAKLVDDKLVKATVDQQAQQTGLPKPVATNSVTTENSSATAHQAKPNISGKKEFQPTSTRPVTGKSTTKAVSANQPATNKPVQRQAEPAAAISQPARKTEHGSGQLSPSSKQPTASQAPGNDNEAGSLFGFGIFLLLIIATGYGAYYFIAKPEQPSKTIITYRQPAVVNQEIIPAPVEDIEQQQTDDKTGSGENENEQAVADIATETEVPAVIENETQKQPATITENSDQASYRASIEQSEDGITIILNAPEEVKPLTKQDPHVQTQLEEPPAIPSGEQQQASNQPEAETPTTTITETVAEPTKRSTPEKIEIIHVVVKGDTLWHIARRYVENPFLYPELARLSNIKNPHRIYPGDKVRIIKYLN